jgi:hypothetical protein
MVIYRTADGQPGYHQTEELDDAVQYVEHLRNSDGVDQARIFRMEEVVFDFKPYYKVEVGNEAPAAPAPAVAPATPAFTPAPAEERGGWLDRPVADTPLLGGEPAVAEPTMSDPVIAEPVIAEPAVPEPVADTPLLAPEPAVAEVDAEPEPAAVLDSIPPPPPPPADNESESGLASNGMGARRGLFGR